MSDGPRGARPSSRRPGDYFRLSVTPENAV